MVSTERSNLLMSAPSPVQGSAIQLTHFHPKPCRPSSAQPWGTPSPQRPDGHDSYTVSHAKMHPEGKHTVVRLSNSSVHSANAQCEHVECCYNRTKASVSHFERLERTASLTKEPCPDPARSSATLGKTI